MSHMRETQISLSLGLGNFDSYYAEEGKKQLQLFSLIRTSSGENFSETGPSKLTPNVQNHSICLRVSV